ncbi:MAG: hypothetical protein H6914_04895 [Novosphingobium sp.]|nr:hypothetical protein [Novosphingobium sp.]
MIDYFAIGLTHGLLALVALRLLMRGEDGGTDAARTDGPDPPGPARGARRRQRRRRNA